MVTTVAPAHIGTKNFQQALLTLRNARLISDKDYATAMRHDVYRWFEQFVDAHMQSNYGHARQALSAIGADLSAETATQILFELGRYASSDIFRPKGELETIARAVVGITQNIAAMNSLKAVGLEARRVGYFDAVRTHGVWGTDIADIFFMARVPDLAPMRHVAHAQAAGSGAYCPIVVESNWKGPFGVADLDAFKVRDRNNHIVTLRQVIEQPARHVNDWDGPEASFYDPIDQAGVQSVGLAGSKVMVTDALIPCGCEPTETVPMIYTYGTKKLVLVVVPGEGISAHVVQHQREALPITKDNRQRALRVTRESQSEKKGPTSYTAGASVVDDMLINSVLIVQIPLVYEKPQFERMSFMAASSSLSLSDDVPKGIMRGGSVRQYRSTLGTEAGVVTAGEDSGARKALPKDMKRDASSPLQLTFAIYHATDADSIGDELALRIRADIDTIRRHPAFKAVGVENP